MDIEKDLIISILKLTRNGPVSSKIVKTDARVTSEMGEKLLRKMQNDGLLYLQKDVIEADSLQRLKLAVNAIHLGADVENVSNFLRWQEFEGIAVIALERNGYNVTRNLRFKHAGRRWEIDIVGCRKPLVLCVDCKHWHRGTYPSALKRVVEEQVERAFALSKALPDMKDKIECAQWAIAKLFPAVLLLVTGRFKFYDSVPLVPILQLQDFLSQLPALTDLLKYFTKP